ncbi:hypothetical protein NE599_22170, partial [[Clostridium] symbiosum]|nr:hypothetical protein [[Clostridium] symbiosum]
QKALLVAYSLYVIGLAVAILVVYIVHRSSNEKYDNILLIELPEYKTPNLRTVAIYVWDKVKDYLRISNVSTPVAKPTASLPHNLVASIVERDDA